MIDRLKQFFAPSETTPEKPDAHQLTVAATALMVQLSRVDSNQDDAELKTIVDCAVSSQQVTREEAEDILADALSQADDATSLYEFTGQLNEHLDQQQKQALLESIWRVAFADGRIDKYEAHLIRRMADLLHLNHREYIQARHRAEGDS
ncbi:tellurite resistance TerB family protein [Marinobacter confluentis]|uniref:TerB family tellurite resistance protein n=1 Tax=Marinobacter confluentis TaxID=1697557 RepID=A0A4Z1BTB3_9GAMM|nr:TerB family tellurite resistance protein [Marinobacter confluentis]TGN41295.1 TerB family tellurite resistance protein [Marinobacter confluentis]